MHENTKPSAALRSVLSRYRAARSDLIEVMLREQPDTVVVRRRTAYWLTTSPMGSPKLHQAPAVRLPQKSRVEPGVTGPG